MEQPDMVRETTAPQTDEPPAVLTPPKKKKQNALTYPLDPNGSNYRITMIHRRGRAAGAFSAQFGCDSHTENRGNGERAATSEEQAVLAQYVAGAVLQISSTKEPAIQRVEKPADR